MFPTRSLILSIATLLVGVLPAQAITLAAIGDSYTDEYNNVARRNMHSNWVRQLGTAGLGIDFGTSNPWLANYPLNFAFSGATTNDALLTQLPNLLGPNAGHPENSNLYYADYVVVDIGLNDYHGLTSASPSIPQTYIDIGNNNAAVTEATIGGFAPGEGGILGNIKSLVDIIHAADPDKRIILANIADWRATRPFRQARIDTAFNIDFRGTGGPDNALLRQQVYYTIKDANRELAIWAKGQGIPLINKFLLLNKATRKAIPLTKEDRINYRNEPDITGVQGDAYDLWADGLHPGTAFEGLYANAVIAALNYYGEDLDYLTSQQIIDSYVGAAILPTLPLHPAWDFSRYVITPPDVVAATNLTDSAASLSDARFTNATLANLAYASIPEPSAALSLLMGASALAGRRHQR